MVRLDGDFALNAVAGKPKEQFGAEPRTYDDMRSGCHDIAERIKDMDLDGVWAQTCFPNMAGFAGRVFEAARDKELAQACVTAYNDWILDEWCAYAPDRQIPVALLPYWDMDAAVNEVYRVAEKGARTYTFLELPHLRPLPRAGTETPTSLWPAELFFASTGVSCLEEFSQDFSTWRFSTGRRAGEPEFRICRFRS